MNELEGQHMAARLRRYYELLEQLVHRHGDPRKLAQANGRMAWPRRGVYFIFEAGEIQSGSGAGPRVVRIGTHGLKSRSSSTLWGRLAQHRGSPTGGNHRGSVFRQLIGLALAVREPAFAIPSWSIGASTTADIIEGERVLEARVSAVIGAMHVAWLPIDDEPGVGSLRGYIERNSIALVSSYRSPSADPASVNWLGHCCPRKRIAKSGLWNSNHVDEDVDPDFLNVLERLIEQGTILAQPPKSTPVKAGQV